MSKSPTYTYLSLKNWIAASKWPAQNQPMVKALRPSVLCLSSRLAKFRKEHNSEVKAALIASFLDKDYCLPSVFLSDGKFVKTNTEPAPSSLALYPGSWLRGQREESLVCIACTCMRKWQIKPAHYIQLTNKREYTIERSRNTKLLGSGKLTATSQLLFRPYCSDESAE